MTLVSVWAPCVRDLSHFKCVACVLDHLDINSWKMKDIVLVHLYVSSMEDFGEANAVYKKHFSFNPPARYRKNLLYFMYFLHLCLFCFCCFKLIPNSNLRMINISKSSYLWQSVCTSPTACWSAATDGLSTPWLDGAPAGMLLPPETGHACPKPVPLGPGQHRAIQPNSQGKTLKSAAGECDGTMLTGWKWEQPKKSFC